MTAKLGFKSGQVVQEFYYDDDVDEAFRSAVEGECERELADPDYGDVVDAVLVWWRQDDADEEDLADVLVDALANLDDNGGAIWVLTPKTGRSGAVPVGEIGEAAKTCGLQTTSSVAIGPDWGGIRLVSRPRSR